MSTVTVNSYASLRQALNFAQPGDVIQLEPGNYGAHVMRKFAFSGNVTITSADPAHPATFQGLWIEHCQGLTFSNLNIDLSQAAGGSRPFRVMSSANIVLSGLDVHGNLAHSPAGQPDGLTIDHSRNVTVSNSEFHSLTVGVTQVNSAYVTITKNDFHDLNARGVDGGGSDHVTVSYNTIYNIFPTDGGLHPDGIMFWTNRRSRKGGDLNVIGNTIYRGLGEAFQGIFMGATRRHPFHSVTIEGNQVTGMSYNGILVSEASNVLVANNSIVAYQDEPISWLRLMAITTITAENNSYTALVQKNVVGLIASGNTISKVLPNPNSAIAPDGAGNGSETLTTFAASMAGLGNAAGALLAASPLPTSAPVLRLAHAPHA